MGFWRRIQPYVSLNILLFIPVVTYFLVGNTTAYNASHIVQRSVDRVRTITNGWISPSIETVLYAPRRVLPSYTLASTIGWVHSAFHKAPKLLREVHSIWASRTRCWHYSGSRTMYGRSAEIQARCVSLRPYGAIMCFCLIVTRSPYLERVQGQYHSPCCISTRGSRNTPEQL